MALNPSLRLERSLADQFASEEPAEREVRHCIPLKPHQFLERFEYLRYIKLQNFVDRYSFATVQVCDNDAEARRHWDTQKMHDDRVFIHPQRCKIHEGKYWLIFPKLIRHFKVWMQEHAKQQVKDEDMWDILKKIRGNLIYLVEANRPHGNLIEGIGVTTDLQPQPLFLNLGADTGPLIYKSDAQALLHEILEKVEPKFLRNPVIKDRVGKWMSFLSKICAEPSPTPFPHDYTADHVKFVFNYPSSWDTDNKLRFLANMYRLCTPADPLSQHNLMINPEFERSLRAHYSNWPAKLTDGVPALTELVFQFGSGRGLYNNLMKHNTCTNTKSMPAAAIVVFAHNCIRHQGDEAQIYNTLHGAHLRLITRSEVLAQLFTRFYYLIEHIYEAFYMAVSVGGYRVQTPAFPYTIGDVLTARLH